jgi:hypothetical protein
MAQAPKEIYISSFFRYSIVKGPYWLRGTEIRGRAAVVHFKLDTVKNEYVTKYYKTKRFFVVWSKAKGAKALMTWKQVSRKRHRWRKHFSKSTIDNLSKQFCINRDTTGSQTILVTSDQQSWLSCTIVNNTDTIQYRKLRGFGTDSYWFSEDIEDVQNPAIDSLVYQLLPHKFLLREWLTRTVDENKDSWPMK